MDIGEVLSIEVTLFIAGLVTGVETFAFTFIVCIEMDESKMADATEHTKHVDISKNDDEDCDFEPTDQVLLILLRKLTVLHSLTIIFPMYRDKIMIGTVIQVHYK